MNAPRKILIIRPDRLGDLILSLPTAELLKKQYPDSEILYLASEYAAGIATMVPYVDKWIIDNGSSGISSLFALSGKMLKSGADCSVELKPALRTALSSRMAGIKLRIGSSRRGYSFLYNKRLNIHRKGSSKHQSDLDLEMLAALGISSCGNLPRLEITENALEKAKMLVGDSKRKYIIIHPGSRGSAPNWPLENYRKLASTIIDLTGFMIVITGGGDEIGKFDERCIDLNGKTDIEALAGLAAGAELFVSGSTGPLHLVDSLGTKCMAFFIRHKVVGPHRWGPRRNLSNVITPDLECKCNSLSICDCLTRIKTEMALNKIKSILNL